MAAASLGRLTLDLVARIGSFTEPMTRAERQARNSSNNIADSFSVATVAATALGAAVAGISVGGLVAFANQTIQTGSDIKKFAQLANTTFRDFQYYAKGAETAGISMESFADKMKDMQDRIGDFHQSGGGPLADFFENIAPLVGVTIQQFQKLSGPEALQLYYDSLKKVGATQNDMKFYMEAIISDSSLLIPLLENGGQGFKKWGDAAERANAILSDDMIQSLALAKENVQLLNLQWEGLQATFVNAVVPVVQTVSDNMDNVKAVALALTAAIATKLVIQGVILAGTFTMAAIRAGVMEVSLMALQGRATGTAASMGILRGAMAFLGGPAGLAMLAVQGIAAGAAFLYMKKSSDSLDPSLSTQGKSIAELTAEYEKLDATQKRVLTRKATDELNEANKVYREQKNELLGLIDAVTRNSKVSEKDRGTAAQLFEQYRQGKISSNDLATAVNSLATVSDAAKSSIDKKAEAVGKESDTVSNAQSILDVYNGKVKENTKTNRENARSISDQASALSLLTQRQREALKDIQDQVAKANYVDANMAAGWSRERAEYFADYRQNAGLSFTGASLSAQEIKQVEAGYKLQQQTKAREESEKRIEEAKRKQIEQTQKQYSYSGSELKMLQKVAELNAKHNLNAIGATNGIPENLLAAVIAQESKGDVNARSPTGARGLFQATSIFRKQYGLSIADSYNIPVVAEAAAKDLAASYKIFGNWTDAVTAFNAGVTGTKNLLAKGFTGSAAKTKEAKGYAPLVGKWLAGLNGTTAKGSSILDGDAAENVKAWGDYWAEIEAIKAESLERQKNVAQTYFTEEQQLSADNEQKIKDIKLAFAGDQTSIDEYLKLQKIAYQKDVAEFDIALKQKKISAINAYKQMQDGIKGLSGNADNIFAKATMSPTDYASWSLANDRDNAKASLKNQHIGVQQDIMAAPTDVYATDDDRYVALLQAHQEYRDGLAAIDVQYDQQVKDLAQSQHDTQMNIWQDLLTRTGTIFNDMAAMVKETSGESSAAYKAMFLVNQGISMAQAMINTEVAATKAMAEGGYVAGIPMATAIRALGYTSVGLIAAQTISGMAHNGIDNIPSEGTWLLDGGERVLNPQQNKDLTNYLANQNSSGGGDVKIQVNITDSGVNTSGGNSQDQKQLGQMIGHAVRAVIRQEQRQGGLLAK
ncbi:transglycosylase SLT domain-containing protein [Acinetobacter tibetensis]|uniref:Transglycosylase SLT domain-containing protein n=1 Tax=Acinetobacter tibetensis TaxID=2943497 RepID=A0AAE9S1J5_9GAMM|nr:transglycosylase SLT domain-containing protein [Acinetobacter tibetensis]USE84349.1 transglycosylase SLT domain-containing protein [Acinetobacter tibetensis]